MDGCHREVVFLGVASRGRRRVTHDKEHDRLMMAKEHVAILGSLQLGTDISARYARMFVLRTACYGWVGRLPPCRTSCGPWLNAASVSRGWQTRGSELL